MRNFSEERCSLANAPSSVNEPMHLRIHRIFKVARTIADLAGVERVSDAQLAEAIQYRRFDRSQHY